MAIYHFSAQIISRSNGSSAVGSSAYRSGEKIEDERTGLIHDYTRKSGVEHTEILTPDNAPEWASERAKLWNEVEKIEKSKNSQLSREINIALPKELSLKEQIKLTREFAKDTFVNKGMVADIAIHDNSKGNPHAHIMLTVRPFNEQGEWGAKSKKEYILNKDGEKIKLKSGEYKSRKIDTVDWNKKENLEKWREQWAKYANRSLERNGIKERIDHRSLKEQGVQRVPQIHVGPHASAMEKRGMESDRGKLNKEIKETNKLIGDINRDGRKLLEEFKEVRKAVDKKYIYLTEDEKKTIIKAENIVKGDLDKNKIGGNIEKLEVRKLILNKEYYKIKFEPSSLKDDIKLMKEWEKEIKDNKEKLENLPKNIFGRYKDKELAKDLTKRIEHLKEALSSRGYSESKSILEKEERLIKVESRISEINKEDKMIRDNINTLKNADKILDLKECREFYNEYKDQFPESKYLSNYGVNTIKSVNEYCGYKVPIGDINKIYENKKIEFKSSPIGGFEEVLKIFEQALKSIAAAKNYEADLKREQEYKKEKVQSKSKSRDIER